MDTTFQRPTPPLHFAGRPSVALLANLVGLGRTPVLNDIFVALPGLRDQTAFAWSKPGTRGIRLGPVVPRTRLVVLELRVGLLLASPENPGRPEEHGIAVRCVFPTEHWVDGWVFVTR